MSFSRIHKHMILQLLLYRFLKYLIIFRSHYIIHGHNNNTNNHLDSFDVSDFLYIFFFAKIQIDLLVDFN